jgi:hypothetical protein
MDWARREEREREFLTSPTVIATDLCHAVTPIRNRYIAFFWGRFIPKKLDH